MATGPLPLVSNGSDNFLRVVRLVMQGGKALLKEKFDSIHPPANLAAVLQAQKPLFAGRTGLSAVQRRMLYPSPGKCVTSNDFDITLLLRLLKDICSLTRPSNGWYDEPLANDMSVEADLVRIRSYRNQLCHPSGMEFNNRRFAFLWKEISDVFLRIAASINIETETKWGQIVEDFKSTPLSSKEIDYFQELLKRYENDLDVKNALCSLQAKCSDNTKGIESVKKGIESVKNDTQEILRELKSAKKESEENIENECQETVDTSNDFMKNDSKRDGINEVQDTSGETEKQAVGKATPSLSISVDVASSDPILISQATSSATSQLNLLTLEPSSPGLGNHVQPSNYEELMIKIASTFIDYFRDDPHAFSSYLENIGLVITGKRIGSLVITVQCKTIQGLEKLWEEYTSGHLNEMAEQYLISSELLEELGFKEIKLKTQISEEEYQNCRRELLDEGTLNLPIEAPSTDVGIPPSTAMQMENSQTDKTKCEENVEDVWESRLSRDVKTWHFVPWESGSKRLRFSDEEMVVRNISKNNYPSLVGNCGFSEGCHCWKIEVKRGELYAVGVTDGIKLSAKQPYECYWSESKMYHLDDSMTSHKVRPSNIGAFSSGDVCLVCLDFNKKLLTISHLQAGQTDTCENVEVQDRELYPYLILAPSTKVSLLL